MPATGAIPGPSLSTFIARGGGDDDDDDDDDDGDDGDASGDETGE